MSQNCGSFFFLLISAKITAFNWLKALFSAGVGKKKKRIAWKEPVKRTAILKHVNRLMFTKWFFFQPVLFKMRFFMRDFFKSFLKKKWKVFILKKPQSGSCDTAWVSKCDTAWVSKKKKKTIKTNHSKKSLFGTRKPANNRVLDVFFSVNQVLAKLKSCDTAKHVSTDGQL